MAGNSESIDALIMTLVDMGFELDDCQQAIQMGKLSTEAIIDWIVSGKPTGAPSGATLRLGSNQRSPNQTSEVIGSNPFSNPQPVQMDWQAMTSQTTDEPSTSHGAEVSDENVKSRMIVSDEQRVAKVKYDEKQRSEAQKLAREEKLAKKRAKDDVLKRIQEDRETAKAKQAKTSEKSSESKESVTSTSSATQIRSSSHTMLQIRLPNGRVMREKYSNDTTLQTVLDLVTQQAKINTENTQLVQPFPRVVYGSSDMSKTLSELSLTPSGSLVLNKIQATTQDGPQAASGSQSTGPGDVSQAAVTDKFVALGAGSSTQNQPLVTQPTDQPGVPFPPPLPGVGRGQNVGHPGLGQNVGHPGLGQNVGHPGLGQNVGLPGPGQHVGHPGAHNWGGGQVLMNTSAENVASSGEAVQVAGEAMQVSAQDDASDDEADYDDEQQQHLPQGHQGQVTWNHDWGGGGQSLIGPVLNRNMLPHMRKDPKQLAAAAASRRIVLADDETDDMETQPSIATANVETLACMATRHICTRMTDPRQPITGLQGIPHDLAMIILHYLMKERLLKPKTLRLFRSCHLRTLVLDCYPYTTNELLMAARLHTYLLHLSLASCPLITDKGVHELKCLERLKLLNLSGCKQITNRVFQTFEKLGNLVTLVLEDTGINDVGVTHYAQTSPANLQTLNLSRTAVTHDILQALPAIPNLTVLNLEGTQIKSLSGVQRLKKLECLNVANTAIVTESLLLLHQCACMKALNIGNTPQVNGDLALEYITGLQLKYLQLPSRLTTTDSGLHFIRGMPLKELDLTNYINVGDAGIEHVAQIHTLKKLRLGNTKIGDAGLLFLPRLRNLEELMLDRTQVTDQGLAVMSELSKLVELSLSETCITDVSLVNQFLRGCSSLCKLNLSKTAISNAGIQCLALPNLSVLNIDRTFVSQEIASCLTDSCTLPALQSVTYRQAQATPMQEEEDQ